MSMEASEPSNKVPITKEFLQDVQDFLYLLGIDATMDQVISISCYFREAL